MAAPPGNATGVSRYNLPGELGGIETGVRQLLRGRPLERVEVEVRGKRLVVPSAAEILRIKAWLALSRNQTRDYLDIAALATAIGLEEAASVLAGIERGSGRC